MLLKSILEEVIQATKITYGVEPEKQLLLEVPPNPDFGDFAISTFLLKKQLGKNPNIIAKEIVENISTDGIIQKAEACGPYINVTLGTDFFQEACSDVAPINKNGKRIMVEYLSPNTNKPLHLGHFRNGVIGMSVSNMLEYMGNTVVKTNLINDRGIHICKSMVAWQKFANGLTPDITGIKGDHFVGNYYVLFSKESEKDSSLMEEAQIMLKKWEDGDSEVIELWKTMNDWVYAGFSDTYKKTGFQFDTCLYESNTYKLGKNIVDQGMENGIFKKLDSGETVFELPEKSFGKDKDGSRKKVTMLREDGTSVYITQDIGTALEKATNYNLDASIYVVGSEQDYHFKCLFEILQALGYKWFDKYHHLSYGMVELPNGKMKSREGTSVDADDLIVKMKELAEKEIRGRDIIGELSNEEITTRAEKIGLGAIKFYLAKTVPKQKMLFNPEESISFEGATGPYCQYAYARICSVTEKKPKNWEDTPHIKYELLGSNTQERILAQKIVLFENKISKATEDLNPAIIANSVYDLAKAFSQWYNSYQIIDQNNSELSKARLELACSTAKIIKKALGLLGIEILTKM